MRELERDPPTAPRPAEAGAALPALALIGAGRVGGSLAGAARAAGIRAELAGRGEAAAACARARVALLCVPDREIEAAAQAAAEAVPPLELVGHASGARGLDALASCRAAGARTFSFHPLQTIPDAAAELSGCPCAISGSDEGALDYARSLAMALGMRPFAVAEEDRAAYHAAASMASNFLIVLEQSAAELMARAGVEQPRELLAPLVARTAANWAERGSDALTGPIARGDPTTVERHREAIRRLAPEQSELYDVLARRTRELVR